MSSIDYAAAPRAVDVLPRSAARRLTRRDGLLPLVLALELVTGIAFGLAGAAGSSNATSVPARMTLSAAPIVTVLPSTRPVAQVVTVQPSRAPTVGPAVGPLLPGTVRGPAVADAPPVLGNPPVVEAPPANAAPSPYPTHAARDPFAALITPSR